MTIVKHSASGFYIGTVNGLIFINQDRLKLIEQLIQAVAYRFKK